MTMPQFNYMILNSVHQSLEILRGWFGGFESRENQATLSHLWLTRRLLGQVVCHSQNEPDTKIGLRGPLHATEASSGDRFDRIDDA